MQKYFENLNTREMKNVSNIGHNVISCAAINLHVVHKTYIKQDRYEWVSCVPCMPCVL